MTKHTDTPTGWQPIEVPVTDQTALPGFTPIEVTPIAIGPATPAATPTPTPPAPKSKEN